MASAGALLAVLFLAVALWPQGKYPTAEPLTRAAANKSVQATHTVVIKDMKFQTPILTVKVGSTVEWKNSDIVAHTATATGKEFDSRIIAPGGSWKFTAKKTGTFDYICTLHPNMKAKLIVQ